MDLERRVRQHDNDISAIYTMIADIQNTQRRHSNRFEELQEDMGTLLQRTEGLEGRMDGLEGRMDRLESKVDQILDLLRP